MKINFILPPPSLKIAGGYKVVYQYANYLSNNNIKVNIIFNCNKGRNRYKIPNRIFFYMKKIIATIEPRWFKLNKNIKKIPVYCICNELIPDANFIVATACETSVEVNKLDVAKGEKIYFIQDLENWNRTEEDVFKTYKYNMKKIVVSKWLKEIVDKHSEESSIYIPNGIDKKKFFITNNIDNRFQYSISMLYHKDLRKRSDEGLKILIKLKEKYPLLQVELFGSPERPKNLPEFINYTRNANEKQLLQIYNKTSIYLCTSLVEGYGLPGLESMCCGCALVSTACKGVLEYAENNRNSLLSPVNDLKGLSENLDLLLSNNDLRIILAKNTSKVIEDFDLNISEEKFGNTIIT